MAFSLSLSRKRRSCDLGCKVGGCPAERPVAPPEVVATIFHSLGLDHQALLPGPAGRPFPLVDFGSNPIKELF